MVSSPSLAITDEWVKATWQEFMALTELPELEAGRFYYECQYMRIEMSAIGVRHARHNSVVSQVILLFAALKNIPATEFVNASFRATNLREFQPDLSFYIGSNLRLPNLTNSPANLDECDPPTLVVEIGATSLNDDLGRKRLLYERAGIREYWVIDANASEAIAFTIDNRRSGEILESQVLPGLSLAIVTEVLGRSQVEDDSSISRWLLELFR